MQELRYIATVNGINVGTFTTISEADTKAVQAASNGVAGHYESNKTKLIEIRDIKNNYQLVSKRQM